MLLALGLATTAATPILEFELEFSSYLARLCIRLVHGAAFHGWFYIYADDSNQRPFCLVRKRNMHRYQRCRHRQPN